MIDIVKILIAFALIVLLLRLKQKVGYVLLAGAASIALLYLMPPRQIADTIVTTLRYPITLKLLSALVLIRMIEMVLREREILKRMMTAFKDMFHSARAVMISMPLLIGMLPSVGGAYFSAPMVDEATRDTNMSPEEKSFVNYWFRHPWEYMLPLYPGILLASALSGYSLRSFMLANMPYALSMFLLGFVFSMRGIKSERKKNTLTFHGARSFIPVGSIIALVVFFNVPLTASLGIVLVGLFIRYRYGLRAILKVIRHGISLDVVTLILGVMLMKGMMEGSGAVGNISDYFVASGVPLLPTLIALPFLVGMLTGLTVGFVGAVFPLLISLPGGDTLGALSCAFAAGFAGVMLSPVHVCFILTREYFCAGLSGVYRRMALPLAIIVLIGVMEFFLLS